MASRALWILLAGVALVAGVATQQRDWLFAWTDEPHIERTTERVIEARVERAVEESFEQMQVVDSDGQAVDVAPETRRDLGNAIRRLVDAEARLAAMQLRKASATAEQDLRIRRDAARADVERLARHVEQQDQFSDADRDAVRNQIRDGIRATVRTAIPN